MTCPCSEESPDNCQACRDKSTMKNLFSMEEIKEVLNGIGIPGHVREMIVDGLEKVKR